MKLTIETQFPISSREGRIALIEQWKASGIVLSENDIPTSEELLVGCIRKAGNDFILFEMIVPFNENTQLPLEKIYASLYRNRQILEPLKNCNRINIAFDNNSEEWVMELTNYSEKFLDLFSKLCLSLILTCSEKQKEYSRIEILSYIKK